MVSRVILVRHAKPESGMEYTDATRPLSIEGRAVQREMTERLLGDGVVVHTILSSPLPRAQQTAQLIAEDYGLKVEVVPELGLRFDGEALLWRIPAVESDQTLLCVGHAPSMGDFAQSLVGERFLPVGLKKSAAVIVEFTQEIEYGHGKLIAVYEP